MKTQKASDKRYEADIHRRLDDFKKRLTLRDDILRRQPNSHDNFVAWRNPLYELLAITDVADVDDGNLQLETMRFIAQYLVEIFNLIEATVDIQQRLEDKLQKASSAKNQGEFKQILRTARRDSTKIKKITSEDIQNLKWVTEFIKRQSKVSPE